MRRREYELFLDLIITGWKSSAADNTFLFAADLVGKCLPERMLINAEGGDLYLFRSTPQGQTQDIRYKGWLPNTYSTVAGQDTSSECAGDELKQLSFFLIGSILGLLPSIYLFLYPSGDRSNESLLVVSVCLHGVSCFVMQMRLFSSIAWPEVSPPHSPVIR